MVRRESFGILETDFQGSPLVASIDLSLIQFTDRAAFPWFLSLSTQLNSATDQGLPTESEAAVLDEWEDAVEVTLSTVTAYKYVGRVTWNGQRELLFQLAEAQAAAEALHRLIDARSTRPFAFRCERDDLWSHVSVYFVDQ